MSEPISIFYLILNASVVVQIVMAVLVGASFISWIMIFQKGFALSAIRNDALRFEDEFWSGKDLGQLFRELGSKSSRELESKIFLCLVLKSLPALTRKSPMMRIE